MMIADATLIAEEIIELYSHHGGEEYAGEKLTQLEHMVQAAQLAEQQGYDEEVILAAFLHDIGHICEAAHGDNEMDGYGIKDHEEAGADFLRRRGFSERLIRLVQSHVGAKRYLTYKYPAYYDQLSEASKKTLAYQGGRMMAEEAMDYEKDPLFELIIQMRRWDDDAKLLGKPVPDLDKYRQMIIRHLGKNHK
jgi:2-amino-1-hydroxyethylphosphonate dioxygenase (glycine-forming)